MEPPLALRRVINDPIHGMMPFTDEEIRVVDHPLFQRLRGIRQTGLCYLMAPSAMHTRFEHSLGVVTTATKMLTALFESSRKDQQKLYPLHEALPGQAVRLQELSDEDQAWLYRVTRLCALVHDLGHGPLSHTFSLFMPLVSDMQAVLDDPRLQELIPLQSKLLTSSDGRLDHEAVSCLLFAVIWNEIKTDAAEDVPMPRIIARILLNAPDQEGDLSPDLNALIPLIRDLVSSAPIDADRMDYLKRDGRAFGVELGAFDANRILKSIVCVKTTGGYRVGWRESGLTAIEGFVLARFQMFTDMYGHKVNQAGTLMLKRIKELLAGRGAALIEHTSLDAFLQSYTLLSDEVFLLMLAGRIPSSLPAMPDVQALARQLLERKLWKHVYEPGRKADSVACKNTAFAEQLVERLRAEHPNVTFVISRTKVRAMKDLERGALLVRLNAEHRYAQETTPADQASSQSWFDASPRMLDLQRQERARVRIFACLPGDAPTGLSRALKASAWRLAAELSATPT